jgi:NADH dehydrogenase
MPFRGRGWGIPAETGIAHSRVCTVILVTGATGTVGQALLPRLLERGDEVRVLVRDPRRLGRTRVEVRITLGDLTELGDPRVTRQALRGVDTVIHLAASIRDQAAPVEELNGLATARLLKAAEATGIERFVFFSAIGATEFQRTRFFRAKALAERTVRDSELDTTVFAPSIVYDRDDPWVTIMRRLALLPVVPVSGEGKARFEPIWAQDVAKCVVADLERGGGSRRHELAGPQILNYDDLARLIASASGRSRPVIHIPLGLVHAGLVWLRRLAGPAAFATWEEAELMEVPMVAANGAADVRALGVEPRPMAEVLAA